MPEEIWCTSWTHNTSGRRVVFRSLMRTSLSSKTVRTGRTTLKDSLWRILPLRWLSCCPFVFSEHLSISNFMMGMPLPRTQEALSEQLEPLLGDFHKDTSHTKLASLWPGSETFHVEIFFLQLLHRTSLGLRFRAAAFCRLLRESVIFCSFPRSCLWRCAWFPGKGRNLQQSARNCVWACICRICRARCCNSSRPYSERVFIVCGPLQLTIQLLLSARIIANWFWTLAGKLKLLFRQIPAICPVPGAHAQTYWSLMQTGPIPQ